MTVDEIRDLLIAALRANDHVIHAADQDDDAIGVELDTGESAWITVELLG